MRRMMPSAPGAVETWMRSPSDFGRSIASVMSIAEASMRTLMASTARAQLIPSATPSRTATASTARLRRKTRNLRLFRDSPAGKALMTSPESGARARISSLFNDCGKRNPTRNRPGFRPLRQFLRDAFCGEPAHIPDQVGTASPENATQSARSCRYAGSSPSARARPPLRAAGRSCRSPA